MFDAYFKAVLARNRLITETMIQNQQLVADLFSRHLDFGADFLQHQMRVFAIVTQWRDPGRDPGQEEGAAEAEKPQLKVVPTRR
ncbi:MAG: hypothetical protein JO021_02560 [Alphaproteobacteria bacterium]|nr:hypothetical protein [Alphaproteobacteria bacterium]